MAQPYDSTHVSHYEGAHKLAVELLEAQQAIQNWKKRLEDKLRQFKNCTDSARGAVFEIDGWAYRVFPSAQYPVEQIGRAAHDKMEKE